MKTEIINIKTDPATKKKARKVAEEMGFSLSSIVNAYLKQLVKTKAVYFNVGSEEPSDWLIQSLEQAKKDEEEGWVSPAFDNADDALAWLHDPNRRYQNGKANEDRI